jgi:hypothetical protein
MTTRLSNADLVPLVLDDRNLRALTGDRRLVVRTPDDAPRRPASRSWEGPCRCPDDCPRDHGNE